MGRAAPSVSSLIRLIAAGETEASLAMLSAAASLATARLQAGADRQTATNFFFGRILHYAYAGDTALHIAAAAYDAKVATALMAAGAEVGAQNRRGAGPLHYAADGSPLSPGWNPAAQAKIIARLIAAGADPDALDKSGVAPLHRAARTRCSAAVEALLKGGARATLKNKAGSSAMDLAVKLTGRGGQGSPKAKAEQARIIRLLEAHVA